MKNKLLIELDLAYNKETILAFLFFYLLENNS